MQRSLCLLIYWPCEGWGYIDLLRLILCRLWGNCHLTSRVFMFLWGVLRLYFFCGWSRHSYTPLCDRQDQFSTSTDNIDVFLVLVLNPGFQPSTLTVRSYFDLGSFPLSESISHPYPFFRCVVLLNYSFLKHHYLRFGEVYLFLCGSSVPRVSRI